MLNNEKLIELRGEMSQYELGKRSGLSRLTIRAMENKEYRNHNLDSIKKLANGLNVEYKELLK